MLLCIQAINDSARNCSWYGCSRTLGLSRPTRNSQSGRASLIDTTTQTLIKPTNLFLLANITFPTLVLQQISRFYFATLRARRLFLASSQALLRKSHKSPRKTRWLFVGMKEALPQLSRRLYCPRLLLCQVPPILRKATHRPPLQDLRPMSCTL